MLLDKEQQLIEIGIQTAPGVYLYLGGGGGALGNYYIDNNGNYYVDDAGNKYID